MIVSFERDTAIKRVKPIGCVQGMVCYVGGLHLGLYKKKHSSNRKKKVAIEGVVAEGFNFMFIFLVIDKNQSKKTNKQKKAETPF